MDQFALPPRVRVSRASITLPGRWPSHIVLPNSLYPTKRPPVICIGWGCATDLNSGLGRALMHSPPGR